MTFYLRPLALLAAVLLMAEISWAQMIIGHRGASHDAPENTPAAFRLAIEQGADGFEADFYLSADGHVVCLHDKDTERVAGKKLMVAEATFEELRALDVGAWKGPEWRGERITTLREVLDLVPPGKKFFLELKPGPEIVPPTVEAIEASSISADQIVIISFNAETIAACKRKAPHVKAHWLTSYKRQDGGRWTPTVEEVIATWKKSGADGLGTQARPQHVDQEFIARLHDAGCTEIHVWTVNDPEVARFYQNLGVWSITTDRPGWLREQLQEQEALKLNRVLLLPQPVQAGSSATPEYVPDPPPAADAA